MILKISLSLAAIFTFLITSFAQPGQNYSVNDKKAIKLYEEALAHYDVFEYGMAESALAEAIERNNQFIEAYILLSQVHSEQGNMAEAIDVLEKSVSINPRFFPNSFYFLGEMYLYEGQYEEAENRFNTFLEYKSGSQESRQRARLGLRSCEFAKKAIQNPVPFEPQNLGPNVNSENPEYYPCLTADESTLLFTRELKSTQAMNGRHEDFFMCYNDGGNWGPSINVKEINTIMNEGAPTLSPDGQVLIFTACEIEGNWGPDRHGLGSCDLFFSQKIGQLWSKPQNLGEKVNSYYWDSQPSFAADGRTLYFVRGRYTPSGISGQDIWVSKLGNDGAWGKPQKLEGDVNTPYEEESVMIHPDGKTLYFSSNGHPGMGGLDIYVSRLQDDGSWGEVTNLGYPINTNKNENSLLVSAKGEVAYFASDREGGYGKLDLYSFELPGNVRPETVTYAKGLVFDALSLKKLEAVFELIDLETGKVVVESYSNPKSGEFLVSLPVNRDYALNVSRPGYLFYSENFSLVEMDSDEPYYLEVPLEKIKAGSKVVLNNVFFDTDKYDLKARSKVELNKLVEFMNLNPKIRVEISGHTDSVGGDDANKILSDNRAKSVVDFLIESGIEQWRLEAKGYGESQPVASNETQEGRAKNRRTEFKIIE